MAEVDDQELVRRCREELPYKTTAFEALLRGYEPLVFRTCRRYLGHDQEAEEACQDIFLRVFHGLHKFEGRSNFRTWLFRITANACARRYTKLTKRAADEAAFRQHATEGLHEAYAPQESELDDVQGTVGEGLELLAHTDRKVLVLRHVAGLSLKELAEALSLSLSATKMRLYRAEQRLRQAFEQMSKKKTD